MVDTQLIVNLDFFFGGIKLYQKPYLPQLMTTYLNARIYERMGYKTPIITEMLPSTAKVNALHVTCVICFCLPAQFANNFHCIMSI